MAAVTRALKAAAVAAGIRFYFISNLYQFADASCGICDRLPQETPVLGARFIFFLLGELFYPPSNWSEQPKFALRSFPYILRLIISLHERLPLVP